MRDQIDNHIQTLNKYIQAYDFEEAARFINSTISQKDLPRVMHLLTEEHTGLLSYTFVNAMIQLQPLAFWHRMAANIAFESLVHLQGGDKAGLYHIQEAIRLAPEDWRLKEYALCFFEKGIASEEQAKSWATEVLPHEKHNETVNKLLNL